MEKVPNDQKYNNGPTIEMWGEVGKNGERGIEIIGGRTDLNGNINLHGVAMKNHSIINKGRAVLEDVNTDSAILNEGELKGSRLNIFLHKIKSSKESRFAIVNFWAAIAGIVAALVGFVYLFVYIYVTFVK